MLNETAQLSYEQIQNVTQHPSMLVVLLIVWFLPILLYIIIASLRKAKVNGRVVGRMLFTQGTLIVLGVWFLFQAFLFVIFVLYPVWVRMLGGGA